MSKVIKGKVNLDEFFTADEFLGDEDLQTKPVTIGSKKFMLRELPASTYAQYERDSWEVKDDRLQRTPDWREKMIVLAVVHPVTLQPFFKKADVVALGKKGASYILPLFSAAAALNQLPEDGSAETAAEIDTLKNSESTGDSTAS